MTTKIRAGLIGCGHLGRFHLKNLKQIEKDNENISIVGFFDTNQKKASEVAGEYNVISYSKLEDLLGDINTAIIVTPTSTHFDIASKTISGGIHTFIEKPVTDSIEKAYKLLELSRNNDVKIQIGHIERFNPAVLALSNYKVAPLFIESHRLSQFNPRGTDVSVIQDLMIHDIDLILNLSKSKVKSIDANGAAVLTDTIDIANARIKFENGCVANLTASRISQKKMRKMRIFQKNAYISIDFMKNASEIFRISEDTEGEGMLIGSMEYKGKNLNLMYENATAGKINPMEFELNKFFSSIIENKETEVNIEEGIEALQIAMEIIKKIEESLADIEK